MNLHLSKFIDERKSEIAFQSVEITRVTQGCCISPPLFHLYREYVIKKTLAEVEGFKIAGGIINNVICVRLLQVKQKKGYMV